MRCTVAHGTDNTPVAALQSAQSPQSVPSVESVSSVLTRREALGRLAAAAAVVATNRPGQAQQRADQDRPYLDAALRAEPWLTPQVIQKANGVKWAAHPANPNTRHHNK